MPMQQRLWPQPAAHADDGEAEGLNTAYDVFDAHCRALSLFSCSRAAFLAAQPPSAPGARSGLHASAATPANALSPTGRVSPAREGVASIGRQAAEPWGGEEGEEEEELLVQAELERVDWSRYHLLQARLFARKESPL